MNRYVLCVPIAAGVFGMSFIWQSGENYDIIKTSPQGAYSIKIEIRAKEGRHTTRGYTEHGKYQFFKGKELVHTSEWTNSYQYEPTFRQSHPAIEWVDENVLRMGQDRSDQPFYDELIVSNQTNEHLKYVAVSYGKYESFWLFDLPQQSHIKLRASPGFKPNGSSNYFLGYGGRTQGGNRFEGTAESKPRQSPANGPLTFKITINNHDLRPK